MFVNILWDMGCINEIHINLKGEIGFGLRVYYWFARKFAGQIKLINLGMTI